MYQINEYQITCQKSGKALDGSRCISKSLVQMYGSIVGEQFRSLRSGDW